MNRLNSSSVSLPVRDGDYSFFVTRVECPASCGGEAPDKKTGYAPAVLYVGRDGPKEFFVSKTACLQGFVSILRKLHKDDPNSEGILAAPLIPLVQSKTENVSTSLLRIPSFKHPLGGSALLGARSWLSGETATPELFDPSIGTVWNLSGPSTKNGPAADHIRFADDMQKNALHTASGTIRSGLRTWLDQSGPFDLPRQTIENFALWHDPWFAKDATQPQAATAKFAALLTAAASETHPSEYDSPWSQRIVEAAQLLTLRHFEQEMARAKLKLSGKDVDSQLESADLRADIIAFVQRVVDEPEWESLPPYGRTAWTFANNGAVRSAYLGAVARNLIAFDGRKLVLTPSYEHILRFNSPTNGNRGINIDMVLQTNLWAFGGIGSFHIV